jgi:hypothetical protein
MRPKVREGKGGNKIPMVKGVRLQSGTDVAGSVLPLPSGETALDVEEGVTPSTDTLMVCPLGDNTSTGVDVGSRIDLVTILFRECERR